MVSTHERKSAGSETTFAEDLTDPAAMRAVLVDLAGGVADFLTRRDLFARTVTIKVRYSDFSTITRSHTSQPTQSAEDLSARACALLEKTDAATRPVRLLGVSAHNLGPRDEGAAEGMVAVRGGLEAKGYRLPGYGLQA